MAYRPTSHSIKSVPTVFPTVEESRDPTNLIIVYQVYIIIKVLVVTQFKTCCQFDVIWRDTLPGQRLHMSFRAVAGGEEEVAGSIQGRRVITVQYIIFPVKRLDTQYTGCNRRNGPDFGRVFLMLNYTEKPQNTYIQS